ncbi:hypothetical protein JTB14_037224 [Gonioctena quinquepunctata]|nr:hypothetical protein JTB14_037224 [Gonioctena quinquepunctata]
MNSSEIYQTFNSSELEFDQKHSINQQIQSLLDQDKIKSSHSPILIVLKKADKDGNERLRLVVYYRKFNNITESDVYPLPNITEFKNSLGKSI